MKAIYFIIAMAFISPISTIAQGNWDGAWRGRIEMANLRMVLNIKTTEAGAIAVTMDSPDQSAFGLPVESARINGDSIFISDSKYRIEFSGKRINDSTINGVFTQGVGIPLVLIRSSEALAAKTELKKQTPIPPFPYREEEITFQNIKAGVTLSGTITIPSSTNGSGYPAVVLVTGSGPQDRDETVLSHKPFAVIADHLTRAGMVVLRYDDRGVGKSTGDFSSSTSLDFADDAAAAVQYLFNRKEVDKKRVGIIGHSEGGMIAPMVAGENKQLNFIIMLAGPGMPVRELMAEQNVAILKSQGINPEVAGEYGKLYNKAVSISISSKSENDKVSELAKASKEWAKNQNSEILKSLGFEGDLWNDKFASNFIEETSGKWMQYFLNYHPEKNLSKLTVKVLAINGDKDNQVLAESNLAAISAALKKSKSPSFKVLSIPGLNHLFQACNTCTVAEYGTLEETFSTLALSEITNWLKSENIIIK